MAGRKKITEWTAAGAARAAREARIATVGFLREAPIARAWQAQKLMSSFRVKVAHLGQEELAASLLFTGMGYAQSWRPAHWMEATERVLADEARYLAEADLYILSPRMCDVVIAAAQTLTRDDLSLITEDDLPSLSGLVVLPHPILVKAVNGSFGDDRAYLWRTPMQLPKPEPTMRGWRHVPAVRISLHHDSHGPVRPDSFLDFAAQARAQGTPLPPLLLDAIRCIPFEDEPTEEQRRAFTEFLAVAQRDGQQGRDHNRELGFDEERVIGEYTPGAEIPDPDDSFAARFLYAFWRLCDQQIATASQADINHSARVTADRAGVSAEVRVVQLRSTGQHAADSPVEGGREWRHRWVVRMHKVRQWYPSEQRHKVIYRGPYVKGPEDKPLLGGETVWGLVR
jgi:hypothetical protein